MSDFFNEGAGEAGINGMDEREERDAILREDSRLPVEDYLLEDPSFTHPECFFRRCTEGDRHLASCQRNVHVDERYDESEHADPGEDDGEDIYPPDVEDGHLDGYWDDRAETFGYFG